MAIAGNGLPLPLAAPMYPARIGRMPASPDVVGTERFSLPAGGVVRVPSGLHWVDPGPYGLIQIKDPIMNIWVPGGAGDASKPQPINSDGTNYRVVNPTGCVVGVRLTNGGAGYVIGSEPVVSFNSGGAQAVSIIGGAIGAISLRANSGTVTSGAGANYGLTPSVMISAPGSGGIRATAFAVMSGGTVIGFGIENQGAGYRSASAIQVKVIANPMDPNLGSVVEAQAQVVAAGLSGAGSITGVLVYNYGNPQAGAPTVTIAAPTGGTQAAGTAIMAWTATGYALTGTAGSNYASPVSVMSVGGQIAAGTAFTNPNTDRDLFEVRPAVIQGALASGALTATGATVIDGGLFQTTPDGLFIANGLAGVTPVTAGPVTLTMGSATTVVTVQPLGGVA